MLIHAKMEARTSAHRLTSISPWSGRNTVMRDPDFDQVMSMQSRDKTGFYNNNGETGLGFTIIERQDWVEPYK